MHHTMTFLEFPNAPPGSENSTGGNSKRKAMKTLIKVIIIGCMCGCLLHFDLACHLHTLYSYLKKNII
ncbi:6 7-dimethyl-8-ribityllumazine synthase [Bienertia sinuspersici]